jgi:hypothetical protein
MFIFILYYIFSSSIFGDGESVHLNWWFDKDYFKEMVLFYKMIANRKLSDKNLLVLKCFETTTDHFIRWSGTVVIDPKLYEYLHSVYIK